MTDHEPQPPAGASTAAGTRLDPWFDSYAARAHGMRSSEIRALFAVASRPEVVSLAGGMPNLAGLPMEEISRTTAELIAARGLTALQYGSGQGEPELREQITQVMALEDISALADDVVVTTGSQQALDLVTRVFCDPGDVILAESPSYVGALGTFTSYQAEVVHVVSDAEGLHPVALRETIQRVRAAGKNIKFLYTIPNFSNPSGCTQPWQRRLEVLAVCEEFGVLVVEDNPYGLLALDSVREVRGRGLILGLAFEDPAIAQLTSRHAFEAGMIIETAGADSQVVKLLPPLTIEVSELTRGLDILADAVARAKRGERRIEREIDECSDEHRRRHDHPPQRQPPHAFA